MEETIKGTPADLLGVLKAAEAFGLEVTDTTQIVVIPNDRRVIDTSPYIEAFERLLPAPRRRRGTYIASDLASLLAWGKDHAPSEIPVFAAGLEGLGMNWSKPDLSMQLIANYSDGLVGSDVGADHKVSLIGWHDFGARYNFPISESWRAWGALNASAMSQTDFAAFLEDRMADLAVRHDADVLPDYMLPLIESFGDGAIASPSRMLELSRGLQVNVNAVVKNATTLQSGEGQMQYVEEHTDSSGAKLKVPGLFFIRIPVFLDSLPRLVAVRLRYRVDGGKVKWFYQMYAPERVVIDEFKEASAIVTAQGRTLFYGTPDIPKPAYLQATSDPASAPSARR